MCNAKPAKCAHSSRTQPRFRFFLTLSDCISIFYKIQPAKRILWPRGWCRCVAECVIRRGHVAHALAGIYRVAIAHNMCTNQKWWFLVGICNVIVGVSSLVGISTHIRHRRNALKIYLRIRA